MVLDTGVVAFDISPVFFDYSWSTTRINNHYYYYRYIFLYLHTNLNNVIIIISHNLLMDYVRTFEFIGVKCHVVPIYCEGLSFLILPTLNISNFFNPLILAYTMYYYSCTLVPNI